MADEQHQLEELKRKLQMLELRQQQITGDLNQLKKEFNAIQFNSVPDATSEPVGVFEAPVEKDVIQEIKPAIPPARPIATPVTRKQEKTPLEEFIGTNLLNKIGIAILVIGIGIGAKYAIDHDLISPLTRIVLGYLCGAVLIGLAVRLKPKYENFSAVLLSGGMAVFYFITFAAYDLYDLMPKLMAFGFMVIFTAFTVYAAIQYNMQVIAIIGLVGAYGVPFLLSDGSGQVGVLFAYVSLINIGILFLSFKKVWKALYYSAFILTWLIFTAWLLDRYTEDYLMISLLFSSVFFLIFYVTLLSYKLLQGEPLARWDVVLLMSNSFIYYGSGCYALNYYEQGEAFLGLFTVFNAVLHFLACYVIYKKQEANRDMFYFVAGLVLVFLTLAVPVQLNGNWVTLIWGAESVLLFWIGRNKNFPVYERLSYILIGLTFISLIQDWGDFYNGPLNSDIAFFLNIQFLSSILVTLSFGTILGVSLNKKQLTPTGSISDAFTWILPVVFITTLYFSFFNEIANHWNQRFSHSAVTVQVQGDEYTESYYDTYYDQDLPRLKNIWLMIYTALFITIGAIINQRWIKNTYLSYVTAGGAVLLLFNFVVSGLPDLTELRDSFLTQVDAKFYYRNSGNIIIRYVSFVFMIPLLWVVYKNSLSEQVNDALKKSERIFIHFIILTLLSSELINVLDLSGIQDSDKLALSILWGTYALALIVFGLMRNLKFVRITGISVFGVTLIKLFFYDLSGMGTIAKTVVMMILGALLLVASFLYNKFKVQSNTEGHDEASASNE